MSRLIDGKNKLIYILVYCKWCCEIMPVYSISYLDISGSPGIGKTLCVNKTIELFKEK